MMAVEELAPRAVAELVFVLAVEKLLGIEAPQKAVWMRMLLAELNRIHSHLIWLATAALELGAISMFWYCFREREQVLDLFELRGRPDALVARLQSKAKRSLSNWVGPSDPVNFAPGLDGTPCATGYCHLDQSNPIPFAAAYGAGLVDAGAAVGR